MFEIFRLLAFSGILDFSGVSALLEKNLLDFSLFLAKFQGFFDFSIFRGTLAVRGFSRLSEMPCYVSRQPAQIHFVSGAD